MLEKAREGFLPMEVGLDAAARVRAQPETQDGAGGPAACRVSRAHARAGQRALGAALRVSGAVLGSVRQPRCVTTLNAP